MRKRFYFAATIFKNHTRWKGTKRRCSILSQLILAHFSYFRLPFLRPYFTSCYSHTAWSSHTWPSRFVRRKIRKIHERFNIRDSFIYPRTVGKTLTEERTWKRFERDSKGSSLHSFPLFASLEPEECFKTEESLFVYRWPRCYRDNVAQSHQFFHIFQHPPSHQTLSVPPLWFFSWKRWKWISTLLDPFVHCQGINRNWVLFGWTDERKLANSFHLRFHISFFLLRVKMNICYS